MRMRMRIVLGACVFLAACVDLFHSTDFDTFCTLHPDAEECGGNGDAGSDAIDESKLLPDFCTFSAAEAKDKAAHTCAWLGACEGPLDSTKLGACMAAATLAYDCAQMPSLRPQRETYALWACLSVANTCTDVDACIFQGSIRPCPAVAAGNAFTVCDDRVPVRYECSDPAGGRPTSIEPCLLHGRTCTKRNESVAECTGAAANHCTTTKCSGTAAQVCGTGGDIQIDKGVDCKFFGAGKCVETDAGPACAPMADAAACANVEGVPTCSNATVRTCVDQRVVQISCTALGTGCPTPDGGATNLLAPETECGQAACSGDDDCNGNILTSCHLGVSWSVDCSKQGLGACKKLPNGYAACASK